jgi:hypothetical protein
MWNRRIQKIALFGMVLLLGLRELAYVQRNVIAVELARLMVQSQVDDVQTLWSCPQMQATALIGARDELGRLEVLLVSNGPDTRTERPGKPLLASQGLSLR